MSETSTIESLAKETAALVRTHQEAIAAARSFHDPDLTPEAMRRNRDQQEAAAREVSAAALAGVRSGLESALKDAATHAAANRPHIPEDPAAILRAEHVWKYDILPVLEAGETLKSFLRTASAEEALAAERFGRGYLAAVAKRGGNPLELEPGQLESGVSNRLSLTVSEGHREGFEESIRAQHAGERLQMAQGLAVDYFNGQDELYQGAYGHSASVAADLGA